MSRVVLEVQVFVYQNRRPDQQERHQQRQHHAAAAWRARLGFYRYAGQDDFVAKLLGITKLRLEQGFPLVESRVQGEISLLALQPVGDDRAIVRGLGRGRGGTLQVLRADGREYLQYAGLSFERVTEEEQT